MADFQDLFKLLKDSILPPFCTICGKVSSCCLCDDCRSAINLTGENICPKCGHPFSGPNTDTAGIAGVGRTAWVADTAGSADTIGSARIEGAAGIRKTAGIADTGGIAGTAGVDKKEASGRICSLCKNENFYFFKSRSFAFYEGTAAELIKKYKYGKYYYLKDILAGFLKTAYKNYYSEEKIDFIETVPDKLPWQQLNRTGETGEQSLNHMQVVASRLAVLLNIPYLGNIKKIKKTQRQQLLDRSGRKLNLSGAFKVINRMQTHRKNYLVIDDVWTTGSTLNEVSIALKNAGADRIYLLTIARGIL